MLDESTVLIVWGEGNASMAPPRRGEPAPYGLLARPPAAWPAA